MKILFVNPRFPNSLWRLTGITDILPQRCAQTPLGLLTVAALTPPDFDVELRDENVRPLDFETDADVVAIACWNIQYGRARQIAEAFRKQGKMVVVGGPYPSLCPERFTDGSFDVVFDGEVEITWPQFCDDLRSGSHQALYKQEGNVVTSRCRRCRGWTWRPGTTTSTTSCRPPGAAPSSASSATSSSPTGGCRAPRAWTT